ncbi:N-(5'-phosphoribosyl)anthranilate isomerase [Fibrella aquatilis]|uniref:N-(5'-phosphoribosyl)anthranilate isomerase n=1 Tax=Fibrella aquatilis TaxID=2817059 RepID=A0A939G7M5_9BACT|nr:N-(5'-phosphoribosyl)anthranilate isomerase [Fibrella aquatilis]MBO0931536.1 N-(5'-phosphoribosyl)anthranilate isomerase [Fibrella aquatilis]
MALQTTVKISNVTNLSDARYCAGMGVDMLGFSMDSHSADYVAPEKVGEMRGWVAGVQIVGETQSIDPEAVSSMVDVYQPDMVQVDEAALLPFLHTLNKPLILRLDLVGTTLAQLDTLASTPMPDMTYLLLESASPVHFDDDLLAALGQLASRHAVLLGTGISPDNVHTLLTQLPLAGIALAGENEERPGSKDFGALMDVLETLESSDE